MTKCSVVGVNVIEWPRQINMHQFCLRDMSVRLLIYDSVGKGVRPSSLVGLVKPVETAAVKMEECRELLTIGRYMMRQGRNFLWADHGLIMRGLWTVKPEACRAYRRPMINMLSILRT